MACIFCKIFSDEAAGHVLFRSEHVAAFLSLEGHPLIAPLKHCAHLDEIDEEIAAEIFNSALTVANAVRAATNCNGMNLILSDGQAAGQDVFHIHLHVKPRWIGDDVHLSWNTEVVPDADRAKFAGQLRAILSK